MVDAWHQRRLEWICSRAVPDSIWEDAHTFPSTEQHEQSRKCYCRPQLLCRKCMTLLCNHPQEWGKIVSHQQAS